MSKCRDMKWRGEGGGLRGGWGDLSYIESCHRPVEWVTLILCHVKYRTIPTYKVTEDICQETETRGLVPGIAHAEWG